MYHRVLDSPDPLRTGDTPVDYFKSYMRILTRYFNVLLLSDASKRLQNGSLPSRAVSITFDDGYADNYRVAWPVLRQLDLPATIFVATGFLDGGRMWNDTVIESIRRIPGDEIDLQDLGLGRHATESDAQRAGAIENVLKQLKYLNSAERDARTAALSERSGSPLPDDLMLETSQVRELSQSGIEIGAHTITHPSLKSTDAATAANEITEGKRHLEDIICTKVRSFAFPNGKPGVDYDPVHVELVRDAGFDCAVSTTCGVASSSSDILQLPRFAPWAESSLRFGLRMLRMYW